MVCWFSCYSSSVVALFLVFRKKIPVNPLGYHHRGTAQLANLYVSIYLDIDAITALHQGEVVAQ